MKNFIYKGIDFGSDPEFFIATPKGKLVSSIGIVPGTKDNPHLIKALGEGFAIQKDNVLGEFNIPVSRSPQEAVDNINTMKSYISGLLDAHGLMPVYQASGVYDLTQLTSKEAKEFGCCPDYNCWTLDINESPNAKNKRLRSAGFHIHVGYITPTRESSILLLKAMDLFIGVPSVIIDTDMKRRSLYGKAGCFRFTDFGFEYRVLSGKFIENSDLMLRAFTAVYSAAAFLNSTPDAEKLLNENAELIQETINSGDIEKANYLIEKFNINF